MLVKVSLGSSGQNSAPRSRPPPESAHPAHQSPTFHRPASLRRFILRYHGRKWHTGRKAGSGSSGNHRFHLRESEIVNRASNLTVRVVMEIRGGRGARAESKRQSDLKSSVIQHRHLINTQTPTVLSSFLKLKCIKIPTHGSRPPPRVAVPWLLFQVSPQTLLRRPSEHSGDGGTAPASPAGGCHLAPSTYQLSSPAICQEEITLLGWESGDPRKQS